MVVLVSVAVALLLLLQQQQSDSNRDQDHRSKKGTFSDMLSMHARCIAHAGVTAILPEATAQV